MKNLQAFFVAVLLLVGGNFAMAADIEVLRDKDFLGQGSCYFAGERFLLFTQGSWISPKGVIDDIDRAEACLVFVKNQTVGPVWLLILDKRGQSQKIITWDEQGEFETVWQNDGNQDIVPAKPEIRFTSGGTSI